jgi:hypothetical protein
MERVIRNKGSATQQNEISVNGVTVNRYDFDQLIGAIFSFLISANDNIHITS